MKLVSSLALGAALVLGGVAVAPVVAKEKPAEGPAPYAYKLGKEFRAAAAPVQAALTANDNAGALAKIDALDALAQQPDEKFVSARFRLQAATASKNTAEQAKAVDAMLASGSGAATEDLRKLNFYMGDFAYRAGDYPKALPFFQKVEALAGQLPDSVTVSDLYLLLAETNFKNNTVPAGLAYVDKAIAASQAAGTKPPEAWYARAASVAYKAKLNAEASKWTRAQVAAYPTAPNWRSALVIYRDAAGHDGNMILDIYRLMRLTKSLDGERDYYEYASMATERGLPGEAKSIVEEGFASGKAPRSSVALSDTLKLANGKIASDRASLAAAERQAAAGATGKVAAATGDAYLGYGDDAKAAALYRMALQKGGVDADQVNTRLGIALARSGQGDAAKQAFATVKGPRTDLAAFWALYLDQPKV